jgi:hypothetical protein
MTERPAVDLAPLLRCPRRDVFRCEVFRAEHRSGLSLPAGALLAPDYGPPWHPDPRPAGPERPREVGCHALGRCRVAVILGAQRTVVCCDDRNVASEQADRLGSRLRPAAAAHRSAGFLHFVHDAETPRFRAGAGAAFGAAEGQRLSWVSGPAVLRPRLSGPGRGRHGSGEGWRKGGERIGWCADRELAPGRGGIAPILVIHAARGRSPKAVVRLHP